MRSALLVVLALQLSSVAHLVGDAFGEGDAEHDDGCDGEDEGRDCPPGCPACHCIPRTAPLAVVVVGPVTVPEGETAQTLECTDRAPTDPHFVPVYRPPRV